MSVYAISDIHGALDELQHLLKKAEIRFDGSDELYLLGDFADWGEKSIETLLFVKQLDEKYDFVHCTMGNHELMFLNTALAAGDSRPEGDDAENWLLNNRGLVTWQGFRSLPKDQEKELLDWIQNLRLSYDVNIGPLTFMLAHAYPYYYDCTYPEKEAKRRRQEAVWRRLLLRENPFADYTGKNHYDYLVCGHTISEFYFQELRSETSWKTRKPAEAMRNRIYRGEMFIDIDCGAKCMDVEDGATDALKVAAIRAQLACLRLDDMEGFYVHRPVVQLPELQNLQMPDLHPAAEKKTVKVHIPEARLPEVHFPELHLPENISIRKILPDRNRGTRESTQEKAEPKTRWYRKG